MGIHISYQPTLKELVNASLLYMEKRPSVRFSLRLSTACAYIVLLLLAIKLYTNRLQWTEWLFVLLVGAWLVGRVPFTKWLLSLRIKRMLISSDPLNVDISANGISWGKRGKQTGSTTWNTAKYVVETPTGFILAANTNQMLWLPFRGFSPESSIQKFKEMIAKRNIQSLVSTKEIA